MKRLFFFLSVCFLCVIAVNSANAYTIYYDRMDWESDVTGTLTIDNFDNNISPADSITFDSGVTSARSSSMLTNYVGSNGYYLGQVNQSSTITWVFPMEITAFSFDVTSIQSFISADFDETGILSFNAATDNLTNIYNGFIGVIGEGSFDSIVFSNNLTDLFIIDNLSFNDASPIPEPTTMLLLGSGLVGLAGFRRKIKKT